MPHASNFVRSRRPRWPLFALLGASLVAAGLALAPSRAEALTSSGYCAPVGVFYCYKPEIVWGPFGPQVNLYVNTFDLLRSQAE